MIITPMAMAPPRRRLRLFWRVMLRNAMRKDFMVSPYSDCMARTGLMRSATEAG